MRDCTTGRADPEFGFRLDRASRVYQTTGTKLVADLTGLEDRVPNANLISAAPQMLLALYDAQSLVAGVLKFPRGVPKDVLDDAFELSKRIDSVLAKAERRPEQRITRF